MSEIKFVNVAFSYAEKRVLDKVDFVIQPGSFVGVVGPNGAGKSTLLKLAAGLLMPMQGAIAIGNKNCTKAAHAGMIGYVPQQISDNYVGFPANVREIIETGLFRVPHKARRHVVEHMLKLTGLEGLDGYRIDKLSGGQRQRVLVARALAANPRVLLLDEPTSGIDAPSGRKLFELLKELNTKLGITILMVSHDILSTTEYATQIMCVNRGVCFFGTAVQFAKNHLHEHLIFEFPVGIQ